MLIGTLVYEILGWWRPVMVGYEQYKFKSYTNRKYKVKY